MFCSQRPDHVSPPADQLAPAGPWLSLLCCFPLQSLVVTLHCRGPLHTIQRRHLWNLQWTTTQPLHACPRSDTHCVTDQSLLTGGRVFSSDDYTVMHTQSTVFQQPIHSKAKTVSLRPCMSLKRSTAARCSSAGVRKKSTVASRACSVQSLMRYRLIASSRSLPATCRVVQLCQLGGTPAGQAVIRRIIVVSTRCTHTQIAQAY
jgi:hypothetical protein